jgi:hypothetical protein
VASHWGIIGYGGEVTIRWTDRSAIPGSVRASPSMSWIVVGSPRAEPGES